MEEVHNHFELYILHSFVSLLMFKFVETEIQRITVAVRFQKFSNLFLDFELRILNLLET